MAKYDKRDDVKKDAKIAVYGIFKTRTDLERCVDKLQSQGFRSSDVSALMPRGTGSEQIGTEKATKAPEGAATGAGVGTVLGGTLGWLVGIGSLAIPGVGPFIAAGPIMAALAGAGVGAAVGGLSGSLIGAGIPEYEAKRYEGYLKEGRFLLSVHCDDRDWKEKAKNILEMSGAEDISSAGEADVPGEKDKDIYRRDDKDSLMRDERDVIRSDSAVTTRTDGVIPPRSTTTDPRPPVL